MKRFLSIDYDYFIDASAEERSSLFPDGGNENLPATIRDYIWDSHYSDSRLKEIGVIKEFKDIKKMCRDLYCQAMITDSHKHLFDFIMQNTFEDEEFEVYNIDFHHDLYDYRTGSDRVNCGNWATILREERPNMTFLWVKRDDSDVAALGIETVTEFPKVEIITFEELQSRYGGGAFITNFFDFLFLCRSAMWSPPHLDKHFVKLVKTILDHCPAQYENGIDKPRKFDSEPSYFVGVDLASGSDTTVIMNGRSPNEQVVKRTGSKSSESTKGDS